MTLRIETKLMNHGFFRSERLVSQREIVYLFMLTLWYAGNGWMEGQNVFVFIRCVDMSMSNCNIRTVQMHWICILGYIFPRKHRRSADKFYLFIYLKMPRHLRWPIIASEVNSLNLHLILRVPQPYYCKTRALAAKTCIAASGRNKFQRQDQ